MKRPWIRGGILSAGIMLFAASTASPANNDATRRQCRLAQSCALTLPHTSCGGVAVAAEQPVPRPICQTATILGRSSLLDATSARRVWPYLGHEHQIVYQVEELLHVPVEKLAFMFERPDIAARWLSEVADEPFSASFGEVRGQRWIDGAHGERFKGRALLLAGAPEQGRMVLLGYGSASFWRWEFRGKTVFDIAYEASRHPGHTRIRVRVYAAPGSDWLYEAMASEVFHAVARRFASGILDDIEAAAGRAAMTAAEQQAWRRWLVRQSGVHPT
ncbi:MAG: hypothetical protein D6761_00040 [Candidatus Dadabacteria bacterium]|nr:MAG: hypothetical protein D6761_00040 [Candidatus Dadabacteria bacterium]